MLTNGIGNRVTVTLMDDDTFDANPNFEVSIDSKYYANYIEYEETVTILSAIMAGVKMLLPENQETI